MIDRLLAVAVTPLWLASTTGAVVLTAANYHPSVIVTAHLIRRFT